MAIQSGTRPPARSWRWPVPETAIPEDLAVLEHLLTTRTRLRLDDLQEPAPVSLTEWSEAWKAVSDKSASTLQEFRQDADHSASIWTRAVAARCEDEGLWLAAHFHLDRLVETARREDADLLLRRANAEAELGLWDESTRDLSRVARLRPDSVHPKLLQAHIRLGQGDLDGYRTACRELRPLMANETDPQTLADYVRLASAVPGTLEAPQQLIELADRAASHYSGLWDVDLARKWAGIRSGHAREVVAACNQALGSGDIPGHIRLWAAVIAIAAENQLGEPDKALVARETLEKVLRQSSRPNWRERAVIESVKRSGPS
jgi:hypothetical protein